MRTSSWCIASISKGYKMAKKVTIGSGLQGSVATTVKSIKDLFTESKLEETQRLTDESDARRELNVSKTAELESANKLLEAQLANKRLQAELNKTEPAVETPKPE